MHEGGAHLMRPECSNEWIPSAQNLYKASMQHIATFVGLEDYVTSPSTLSRPATGVDAIYFHYSESPDWKAHLHSLPREARHQASVRRRLSTSLWTAAQRDACLWCWFPRRMCICAELDRRRAALPWNRIHSAVEVTMLLHAEEVMRSTNSGHIAAYILGAPIRVWGIDTDDAHLAQLAPVELGADGRRCAHVSLYPEKGADTLEDFVRHLLPQNGCDHTRVHLLLSDGTWGQATALNRHIPSCIPRVALAIDESYDSLFKALRKTTRETGVSTLEATSMAMAQCLHAWGDHSGAAAPDVTRVLTDAMKHFVDLKCLLKYQDPCFTHHTEAVERVIAHRDEMRRDAALERLSKLHDRAMRDPAARKMLLPPVLNYCYMCDLFIGWFRMPEHVLGKGHQEALRRGASSFPSEYAGIETSFGYCKNSRRKTNYPRPDCTSNNGKKGSE